MQNKSHLEPLESRIAPATLFAITSNDHLLRFDSSSPGTIEADLNITGVGAGEIIRGLDSRPATGELYILTVDAMNAGRLYTLDPMTGAASAVGNSPFATNLATIDGYGFDFNPVSDVIRIVNGTDQSFRVDPTTGALIQQDTNLDDPASAADYLSAVAYTNNRVGATETTLYGIDWQQDKLVRIGGENGNPSPDGGQVTTVGVLVGTFTLNSGFDIASNGTAYAVMTSGAVTSLFTVNLATGAASAVGPVGDGQTFLRGLTAYQPVVSIGATGKTATYTDVDGDLVTVTTSKGTLTASNFHLVSAGGFGRAQLATLDLDGNWMDVQGTNLTISAKKSAFGDGRVDVGAIQGSIDLGNLTVKGDVGRLQLGNMDASTPAVKKLALGSIGVNGLLTTLDGVIKSELTGGAVSIVVGGDVNGELLSTGSIGSVTIAGDVRGSVLSQNAIKSVTVLGSVDGRDGAGIIAAVTLGKARVAGSVLGGTAPSTGYIGALESVASISIGRDLVGGDGAGSGYVSSLGKIGSVTIGGSILGGTGANTNGSAFRVSGALLAGDLPKVTIGGSIVSSAGADSFSGLVTATSTIGTLTVKGDLLGNPQTGVHIIAEGKDNNLPAGATSDVAIAKLVVGGRVQYADILAGFSADTSTGVGNSFFGVVAENGDASIGSVSVGRDWVASNLVAGAFNDAMVDNVKFGDANDKIIGMHDPAITAKIASVVIKGRVLGTVAPGDHYGFVAQQIGSMSIGGAKLPLTSGTDASILLAPLSNDVRVHEI
jgi:hypothetical protein